MGRIVKIFYVCMMCITAILSASLTINAAESTDSYANAFDIPSNSNYSFKVSENEKFELMADSDGRIAVLDKRNRQLYESNPSGEEDPIAVGINKTNLNSQLFLTTMSGEGTSAITNSAVACVNKNGLTYCRSGNDGIRYDYNFVQLGIIIPIEYRLTDEGLSVSVLVNQIQENSEETKVYLSDFSLLPFFAAADMDDEGYIFVPDGSGALIEFNNDKGIYGGYSQNIYSRDQALVKEQMVLTEEAARIPVFGMKNADHGFLAVITSGESKASVNAMTSGTLDSYNYVYSSFSYRFFSKSSFVRKNYYHVNTAVNSLMIPQVYSKIDEYNVEYRFLMGEKLSYVDMANSYREYLLENGILTDLIKTDSSPFYLSLLGGIELKDYVMGVEINKLIPLTTFSEAEQILTEFKSAGVDDIIIRYEGWQNGGLESAIPSKIKFEKNLGGVKGYKNLVEYVSDNDLALFMEFDFVNLYKSGNGISYNRDSVQMIGNTPSYQYIYNLNTLKPIKGVSWRLLSPLKVLDSINSMLKDKDDLQGVNISLSTLSNMIYSDFTKKEGGIDRVESIEVWGKAFELCKGISQDIMAEDANAYVFPYVTHIYDTPLYSTKYDIEDEAVPFYQIVTHGYISGSTEPINLNCIPDDLVLKAVETGTALSAYLVYDNEEKLSKTKYDELYSINYKTWLQKLADYYNETNYILSLTASATIEDHYKVMEDVYFTQFSNGVKVYVNYSDVAKNVDSIKIDAKSYIYIEEK